MLNGDGNENRIKINRSNQPKKKKHLHVQHTFFVHFLPLFCTATMPFCTTFNLYGEIVIRVLTHQKFCCLCSCSLLFFHCRSFSPCWPLAFLIFSPPLQDFHVFLPTKLVPSIFSPLL